MATKKGPAIPDLKTLIQAGIDPKTGLPLKMTEGCNYKANIKHVLRIVDEQDAVNRYQWYNLPCNISSQELERLLYYKGQLCFFYIKELNQFFFMPYALDGTIDFYGRFNRIHPVPMTSGTTAEEKAQSKAQADYLSTLKLDVVYAEPQGVELEDLFTKCVLLHDYTKQLGETITPRQIINDALIDLESEMLPFMRTALANGTGVKGVRVNDADQAKEVKDAAKSVVSAALQGEQFIPMIGSLEFQELSDGQLATAEEYLMAMTALDNLRLSTYGIDNGGLFLKQAHTLQAEADMAAPNIKSVYQDGLSIRQNFCNIVNSIWGLGIWCEASESVVKQDLDGDGVAYDRNQDSANTGSDTSDNQKGNDEASKDAL